MEIGFAVPVSGSWATPEHMARVAARAESLGYASLWTFQRLLAPVDGAREVYRSVQDPVVTLAYLAGLTSRARLGVAVLNMPFFAPALLAKQMATLDIVSGGRLDVGLGIGWSADEYAAVGVPMRDRGRRADEYLAVLRTLWTEPVVRYEGGFYRVPPSLMEPKPVQRPHPPVLLGGAAEPALRRAGRLADGWVSSSHADLTTIGESIAVVRAAAVDAGRPVDGLRFVVRGVVKLGRAETDPDGGRRRLTGTAEEIRADMAGLAAQGVTEVFVDLNFDPEIGSPDADPAESIQRAERALDEFAPERISPVSPRSDAGRA
jgi:probable F420-dependent oxidoreductase